MKAWVAQKVEGGFVVNCIDDEGEVCLHLGGTEYKPMVVDLEESIRLVDIENSREVEKMIADHKERVSQLAAYDNKNDSSYTPVSFQE